MNDLEKMIAEQIRKATSIDEFQERTKFLNGLDQTIETQARWSKLVDSTAVLRTASETALEQMQKAAFDTSYTRTAALLEIEDKARADREELIRTATGLKLHETLSIHHEAIARATGIFDPAQYRSGVLSELTRAHEGFAHVITKHQIESIRAVANDAWMPRSRFPDSAMVGAFAASRDVEFARCSGIMASAALVAQEECLRTSWERFAVAEFRLPEISAVEQQFSSVMRSYGDLMCSYETEQFDLASLSAAVSVGPSWELYTGARVINVVAQPDIAEEADVISNTSIDDVNASVEELLSSVDHRLLKPWEGAKSALRSGNPDRERHVANSLRELVSHLLRTLAPNEAVEAWSTRPDHYHEGRPTRTAQCHFICRGINHGPFERFVEENTKLVSCLFKLFQSGTHKLDSDLSDKQLRALLVKTEGFIRFLVITSREN